MASINSSNNKNHFILLVIYIITNSTIISTNDLSQLKLVLMVHRHGDRTPIKCYPNDPFKDKKYWTDGWGQLTKQGKDRMYNLGQYIGQRYKNFLENNPREVHIRSSAADRCLESVSLVLAGIYPPEGRWKWNNDLGQRWQPFPIQTEPRIHDGMLNSGSICPAAEEEVVRIHNTLAVRDYIKERKAILKYVSDNTGLNITDINSAEEVFDTLFIEKRNNYTLPIWVDESTYKTLNEFSDISFYFDYSTKLIQRFRTGLLLADIAKHMKEAIIPEKDIPVAETNTSLHKFHIYSTHDTQIAVLLNAFDVFNMRSPPFGSAIFIELYEINKDHIIKIYYLNDTESQKAILLTLPNCVNNKNECHLGQFLHSIEELLPIDWNHECRNDEGLLNSQKVVMPYLIGSFVSIAVMSLLYMSLIMCKRKGNTVVYQMLPIG